MMHTNVAPRQLFEDQPLEDQPLPGPDDLGSIALLLDVDGTIVDVAITPQSVVIADSLRQSLKELLTKNGGALALVSGRLVSDLDQLFAPLHLPAIGGHGAEMRVPGGTNIQARHADAMGDGFRKLITNVAAADPRLILEDKGSSLALHYRLAPQLEGMLKTKIAAIIERAAIRELDVLHGKAVIEIKSRHFSKGVAVRELMKSPPFLGRRPVFVGDDTTDESVFQILPSLGGVGYSVGRLMPGADGSFASPAAVRAWLASLCGPQQNIQP
jgi:trehalose 6-phosphate phosphatase